MEPIYLREADTHEQKLKLILSNKELMTLVREHFRQELRNRLVEEKNRADIATAKVAVLQEEIKLLKLRSESAQLERSNKRQQQPRTPIRNQLLTDAQVVNSYNHLTRRR
jgi:hypothetical protein